MTYRICVYTVENKLMSVWFYNFAEYYKLWMKSYSSMDEKLIKYGGKLINDGEAKYFEFENEEDMTAFLLKWS